MKRALGLEDHNNSPPIIACAGHTSAHVPLPLPLPLPSLWQVCDTIVRAMQRAAERGVPRWSPDPTQPEGFRVRVAEGEGKRGWLMVRRSLHEPIVTFFAENEVSNGLARSLRELMDHVLCELGDDVLDLDPLRPYVRLQ